MRVAFTGRSGYEKYHLALEKALPGHEVIAGVSAASAPEVVITAGGSVDRKLLELPQIQLVQTVGTGYDSIDVKAATELGVWVANLRASATGNADSVAEHALLLMLALARQLPLAMKNVQQSIWATPQGQALLGKCALVIGLGDIGVAMIDRLRGFGMRLLATRRDASKGGPDGVTMIPLSDLHAALSEADHVIVCARADETNKNLIDAHALAAMKKGAFLVNIARGTLVDLDALAASLEREHLGGAGLDVFPAEPVDPAHPVLRFHNVIATPHIAGVTDVNNERSLIFVADNLNRFARGDAPQFLINEPKNPRRPLHR